MKKQSKPYYFKPKQGDFFVNKELNSYNFFIVDICENEDKCYDVVIFGPEKYEYYTKYQATFKSNYFELIR